MMPPTTPSRAAPPSARTAGALARCRRAPSHARRAAGAVPPTPDGPKPPSHEILGVYITANAADIRAAPVDSRTGGFVKAGASTKLQANATADDVATAVKSLCESLEWRGRVGVSLSGMITRVEGEIAKAGAMSRDEVERKVHAATGLDVAVMSGAEACGFAELKFGGGVDVASGLVMFCMVGGRFSTSLYDDGVIVKNFAGEKVVDSWSDGERLAPIPEVGTASDTEEAWAAYAARVDKYILELEAKYTPNAIVLGGKAGQAADKILPRLTCKTSVVPGTLGFVAGVKGAAALGVQLLDVKATLLQVRNAIGKQSGVSPQSLTDEQLQKVFNKFDTSGDGLLEINELAAATKALGVKALDVQGLMNELDSDNNGVVSFEEWRSWWKKNVNVDTVTHIVSQEEWHEVMETEGDRLICLEVGFTFCRPCKAFTKKFNQIAEEFPTVRFITVYGNENGSTTVLARDELGVKSTPSFYLFRDSQKVHFHSGAKEERLRNALNRHLRDDEWPASAGERPPKLTEEEEAALQSATTA